MIPVKNQPLFAMWASSILTATSLGSFTGLAPSRHLPSRLLPTLWCIAAILSSPYLFAQAGASAAPGYNPAAHVCPGTANSTTLNVADYRGPRTHAGGDYVVIEYNADSLHASWSDYNRILDLHGENNRAHPIDANGSFLPVIETKEKIAVRVCGLHFTDVLTVTTSPTGVPEGGADIRGATVVPPPASSLSTTLDMLQSGTATGGTTSLPGLGLGAPIALPPLSIAGITPGIMGGEDNTPGKYPTYTPAVVNASGKQIALLLYSVRKNGLEIQRLIDRTMGRPYDADDTNPRAGIDLQVASNAFVGPLAGSLAYGYYGAKSAPGSVNGVAYTLGKDLTTISQDVGELSNAAAFDRDMTEVQNVNAQISTLASALNSQAFASNTLLLLNNYSTLSGILDLAKLGGPDQNDCQSNQSYLQPPNLIFLSNDALSKLTLKDFANWTPAQVLTLTPEQIKLLPDDKAPKNSLRRQVIDLQKALTAAGLTATTIGAGDKPLCSAYEKQKFADFWDSYNFQVASLLCAERSACRLMCQNDANCIKRTISKDDIDGFEGLAGNTLISLNDDLNTLRKGLGGIDTHTTQLYNLMNEWYQNSSVEQTDLIQPQSANAFLRLSIVVQRGYTPFTLANAGGTFTPAATANVPPTAAAAASTSTPAHAVKTILIEVHRIANFNLMGGVMLIHVPSASYALQASPSPATVTTNTATNTVTETGICSGMMTSLPPPASATAANPGNGVAYSCVTQTQQTQWQVAGMAGLVWFPFGHDYFPRHNGFANYGRNLWPSMLLATSVTSLGNSMGGVNWEPVSGLDFYAGIASANKNVLPAGIAVNTAIESPSTLQQATQVHAGFAIGVGFDFSVITAMFGSKSTSAATLP